MKKRIVLFVSSVLLGTSCLAQSPKIAKGSTVYVAPMHGYEVYIIAALQKEKVPVVVIVDRSKAEYIIGGVVNHQAVENSRSSVVVNNKDNAVGVENAHGNNSFAQQRMAALRSLGETSTSISVLDPKTTAIVFSYSTDKMDAGQLQKSAEDFAKHLKKFIEKGK